MWLNYFMNMISFDSCVELSIFFLFSSALLVVKHGYGNGFSGNMKGDNCVDPFICMCK